MRPPFPQVAPRPARPHRIPTRHSARVRAGVLALLAVLLLSACTRPGEVARSDSAERGTAVPGALDWGPCDNDLANAADLQCATLAVPVDHDDPEGASTELVLARSPSTGTAAERIGSVVFNPGGPGGSGIEALANLSFSVPPELHDRFDLVAWDPRGVNESSPVRCLDDATREAQLADPLDPTTPDGLDAAVARQQELREACEENNPELIRHMSTADVAADLDLIRDALGDEELTYVGYSYGTAIGATYATLFPDRVRAMVLDGAVSPTASAFDQSLQQAAGFQRTFGNFAAACDADPECELSGRTTAAVEEARTRLDANPLTTESPSGPRTLTRELFDIGLLTALYDTMVWGIAAEAVAALDDGGAAVILALADAQLGRNSDGTWTNSGDAQVMVNCADVAERPSVEEGLELGDRFAEEVPAFSESFRTAGISCVGWPLPANPTPVPTGAGAPPVLVIGTLGDPATPYEWSEEMAAALEGAVLLTYEGDGHTAFLRDKGTCVDDVAITYLVDLTLPPAGTRCAAADDAVSFGGVAELLAEQFRELGLPDAMATCITEALVEEFGEDGMTQLLLEGDIEALTEPITRLTMECLGGN